MWGEARLSQSIELSYLQLAFTNHHSAVMWDVSHQESLRTYSKRQKGLLACYFLFGTFHPFPRVQLRGRIAED